MLRRPFEDMIPFVVRRAETELLLRPFQGPARASSNAAPTRALLELIASAGDQLQSRAIIKENR